MLFHSGTADQNADIAKYGLIAQVGEWVEEVIYNATDDEDLAEEIREKSDAVFLSREPEWVEIKVERKLNKKTPITEEDIKEHGQLSIVVVDFDRDDIYENDDSELFNYGRIRSLSQHPLEELTEDQIPISVESGDIFSLSNVAVDVTLTGDDLVNFLKYYNSKFNNE